MALPLQASEAPQIEACADVAAAAPNGMSWSMTSLLEMASVQSQAEFIQNWSTEVKARVDSALLKYLQAHRDSCLLYTSPSPRDGLLSRMPSSA